MATAIRIESKIKICRVWFQGPFSKPEQLPAEPALLVALDMMADSFRLVDIAWGENTKGMVSDNRNSWRWSKQRKGHLMYACLSTAFKNRCDELSANLLFDELRGQMENST